jgi:hypothetical protein
VSIIRRDHAGMRIGQQRTCGVLTVDVQVVVEEAGGIYTMITRT